MTDATANAAKDLQSILIYANCLHLEPEDGMAKVVSEFAAWVASKTKVYIDSRALLLRDCYFAFDDRSTLTTTLIKSEDDLSDKPVGLTAIYAHGDRKVATRRWITESIIKQRPGAFDVECEVYLTVEDQASEEKIPKQTRPKLMLNLVESCLPVRNTPGLYTKILNPDTADKFVLDVESPFRTAPIVVISNDLASYHPVDAERLREQLVGLANVYSIATNTDSWLLSGIVGDDYACYGEAIRIIWPIEQGNDVAESVLLLPRHNDNESRIPLGMERAAFLSVLRRQLQVSQAA